MTMDRWVGTARRSCRCVCARATARSTDARVANRCAACRNASASCSLSVPSALRSSAAIRVRSLSPIFSLPEISSRSGPPAGPSTLAPPIHPCPAEHASGHRQAEDADHHRHPHPQSAAPAELRHPPRRIDASSAIVRPAGSPVDTARFGRTARLHGRTTMSTIAWIILLVLLIPIIGVLIFVIVVASLVRVPSGSLRLVMSKGRATDTALLPGLHFLPAIRRRMVEEYPSVELAYRAGGQGDTEETLPDRARPLERSGPPTRFKHLDQTGAPWQVTLGDRTTAIISVTVRFRLEPEHLRLVHERFGPNGIFGIVRDESSRAVMDTLGDPEFSIDSLFGKPRQACQERMAVAVSEALEADGILLTATAIR